MSNNLNSPNSILAVQKIEEAKAVLRDLDLPTAQQNECSALTLLALLDLKVNISWSNATNPLLGITPIIKFIADNYGKIYAPKIFRYHS
jgi:hypothetical protein